MLHPATPGWVLLPLVVCGSPPLLAGACWRRWCVVCGVWCVVCGVRRWCVGGVVAGVWCGWSVATPGGGSCVLLPATPGWVSLPVVVGGPRHSWLRVPGAVPRHSWLGSVGGGGVRWGCGWCVVWSVPRHSWRRFLRATPRHSWLGFAAGGGVWSPATPGWGLLAAVVCDVWCVVCGVRRWCAGGVVAGVWCGWPLATPGGGSCVLLPATPGWVPPPVVVGVPRHSWRRVPGAVPRHSWLSYAVGGGVWCVVCGRWHVVCGGGVCGGFVAGVWCGWSLATPGGGSCVLLPATPGWVSPPVVVGVPRHSWRRVPGAVPRHSWLGFAVGGGVWCVVCGGGVLVGLWLVCGVVGPSPLLPEDPVCYSPPLLAGFRRRWWWAFLATPGGGSQARFPATPGWVSLSAVVCGVWCVVCGVWFAAVACVVGLWLVCGVVGPSPLLAEVPVCYSPPLLAGFRCR